MNSIFLSWDIFNVSYVAELYHLSNVLLRIFLLNNIIHDVNVLLHFLQYITSH